MTSQQASNWRPKAVKGEDLLVAELAGELLVYNVEDHRLHCLNDTAVRIWKLCTGRRTVKQIAAELELRLDPASRELVVRNAIAQFQRLGLVEVAHGTAPNISRRELVRRIGIGVAGAVVLPLVTTIVAPTPASAAGCAGSVCMNGMGCPASCVCSAPGSPLAACISPPCWIAAAVFDGWYDLRTIWVRHWLINDYAKTLIGKRVVALYRKFGASVADRVKKNSILKRGFKALFNVALKKAEAKYGTIPVEVPGS